MEGKQGPKSPGMFSISHPDERRTLSELMQEERPIADGNERLARMLRERDDLLAALKGVTEAWVTHLLPKWAGDAPNLPVPDEIKNARALIARIETGNGQ